MGSFRPGWIVVGTGVTVSAAYASLASYSARSVPRYSVQFKPDTPVDRSPTTDLINPANHRFSTESYIVNIPLKRAVSDETLLLSFTRGFFQNLVFAPEAFVLSTLQKEFTRFLKPSRQVWSIAAINAIPPVGTTILGTFQVLDYDQSKTVSTIDLAFGKASSNFAGAHRLKVSQSDSQATLELQCMVCDPSDDSTSMSGWKKQLHQWYAMMLFRSAATTVKRYFG